MSCEAPFVILTLILLIFSPGLASNVILPSTLASSKVTVALSKSDLVNLP